MSITRLLEFQTNLNIYHYDNSMQAIRCTFYVVSSFKSYDVSNFLWYKEGFKDDIIFQRLELHSCLLFANFYEYLQNATTLYMNNHASIICQFNLLLAFWWEGFFERKDKLDKVLVRKSFSNYSVQTFHELCTDIRIIEGILKYQLLCYNYQDNPDLLLSPNHSVVNGCHFEYKKTK